MSGVSFDLHMTGWPQINFIMTARIWGFGLFYSIHSSVCVRVFICWPELSDFGVQRKWRPVKIAISSVCVHVCMCSRSLTGEFSLGLS